MPLPDIGSMRAVADRLDKLGLEYAFVGGSIVNLLLDHPELAPARPTDDVDVILETVASQPYSDIEAKLCNHGFSHDTREDAPMCRWRLGDLTVDIMPTDGACLGLNTAWFKEALGTASPRRIAHTSLRLISPTAFLATKHEAFADRGNGDYFDSPDLEDFIAVIDGRENVIPEIDLAPATLRGYVITSVQNLIATPAFDEALPGHLPADTASQRRLPALRQKLRGIAALNPGRGHAL
jgi:predicted nucleotidyltransferase